jgi:2-keto-4-pentenoate hydratase
MSLSTTALHQIADELDRAERSRSPMAPPSQAHSGLDLDDAYDVQMINAARAVREGRRAVGYKIGLTSAAAQKHFGITHPDFGHLYQDMAVADEDEIDLSRLIQPKIEGEIAFVLGHDLTGPGLTIVDVIRAVDYAVTAMEIIDSRIKDWKIGATDTIADNGSSALYVLAGKRRCINDLDLSALGMGFYRNGEIWCTGAGAAVMGNPLNAVLFLANELGRKDRWLQAGEVVLSGALSGMVTLAPRDFYSCEIQGLGRVSVRVGEGKPQ